MGSSADPVTRSRSLRSILLVAFFCVLIVAVGYGYLHLERDVGASSKLENLPVIKPDPSPARVKAEVAAESEKPAVGQELFSRKNAADDTQAVVVSSKEQPVDLNAKKRSAELQSGGVQAQDGTDAVGQGVGTGGAAGSSPETKDLTLPNSGVISVRTVKVRADGTIIDPTGILKSTAKESSSESNAASPNTSELVASVPKVETNQNAVVSVKGVAGASQGQAVSLSPIPFPPVRPLNLGSETSEGDPIETVSGLLANAQDAAATNPSGGSEAQNQTSLAAGLYSVQFGAPATEGEARALIERVRARMGDSLGTTEIGVFRGENSGKTVFRVRAVNIAKADGQSLCERYVSLGGQCFVTRN